MATSLRSGSSCNGEQRVSNDSFGYRVPGARYLTKADVEASAGSGHLLALSPENHVLIVEPAASAEGAGAVRAASSAVTSTATPPPEGDRATSGSPARRKANRASCQASPLGVCLSRSSIGSRSSSGPASGGASSTRRDKESSTVPSPKSTTVKRAKGGGGRHNGSNTSVET